MIRFHQHAEPRLWRFWVYAGKSYRTMFRLEASWAHQLGLGLELDADDEDWTLGLRFPWLLCLWLSTPGPKIRKQHAISLTLHSGALWWKLWTPTMEWSSKTPRWRDGSFDFADFFLGRAKCSHQTIEEREILVPMPEKSYPATATLAEWVWKRPRWFAKRLKRVSIDIPGGIPFPGKGENSWDCGDDATFGITTGECRSIAEGVGQLVGSVLRDRVRNGGWDDWTWKRQEEAA